MKRNLILGIGIGIATLLIVNLAIYETNQSNPSAIAQPERKLAPIRVYEIGHSTDLRGDQVITVERGSTVTVPLHIIGHPWLEVELLPVQMGVHTGSRIGVTADSNVPPTGQTGGTSVYLEIR